MFSDETGHVNPQQRRAVLVYVFAGRIITTDTETVAVQLFGGFCAKPPGCAARWVRSQHALKELAGPRLFALSHLFRRTFGNDGAASVTAFRPKVDDPIGRLDHIEIVFNDNNGIALIHQSLQDKQQFAHIFKMQTRGRFVKNIHGFAP